LTRLTLGQEPELPKKPLFQAGQTWTPMVGQFSMPVDIHRNDSWGEGGSGVPVLSYSFLPLFVERMPASGWQIYTDGSNSLQGWFERISRPKGVDQIGCYFTSIGKIESAKRDPLWIISALPI
jgi:hypothetical protein